MKTLNKTIYLCSGTRPAIEISRTDSRLRSISSSKDPATNTMTVIIPLAPDGAVDTDNLQISLGMFKTGSNWPKTQPEFIVRLLSADNAAPYWIDAVAIDYAVPEGCDWQKTELYHEAEDVFFYQLAAPHNPGAIPDDKSSVCMITDWSLMASSQIPIIGDPITAKHFYRVAATVNVGPQYFRTQAFIGGHVVARRAHSVIANLLTYDVECEGVTISNILPTDYYLYNIGDHVFPFQVGDARTELTPAFTPDASYRLCPLVLGTRGVPFGKSFISFDEYANLRVLVGSVVSVATSTNEATVTINGQNYTIPILYHCADGESTNGRKAFAAGDSVLVLWSGYRSNLSSLDLNVIGFTNTVKACAVYAYRIRFETTTPYYQHDYADYSLTDRGTRITHIYSPGQSFWPDINATFVTLPAFGELNHTAYTRIDVFESGQYHSVLTSIYDIMYERYNIETGQHV